MKKRLLLAVLVGAAGISAMAQSPVQLDPRNQGTDPSSYSAPVTSQLQGKRVVTDWYNFIDASDANNGGAISYTIYSNNCIWPDSLVKQRYGDGNGGVELGYVYRHNLGQMFDPKSFYFTELLSEHNPYEVDSINLAYRYFHGKAGSVDTLEIQVFYDDAVKRGTFTGSGEKTAWIEYDRNTETGKGAKQTWRVLLTEDDTSWGNGFKDLTLALPSPASIGRNGLFAVAFRYIPGYAYSLGDTLDQTWDSPEPTNKLNQFQPLIGTDNAKTAEDSYNHGLAVIKSNKYDATSGWATEYIPGDAWNNFNEYVYCSVHLSSPNVSVGTIQNGLSRVYPNPSNGAGAVNIAFTTVETANVTVEVFDLLGNKVQTAMNGSFEAGQQYATVQTSDLKAGVYVYTINANGQVITGKISVTK